MVIEIGGYFGLEKLINNEYHKGLIRLNTATNALLYLLKAKGTKKVYIPYYLCNSVSEKLIKNEFEIEYYRIDSGFKPIISKVMDENEVLYIVNYFGQITNEEISLLKKKYRHIVMDNTHAFFQKPIFDVDTIYSCRKFFGVSDGAYLYTEKQVKDELEVDVSMDRMEHILGRFEGNASDYYSEFQKVDNILQDLPIRLMSNLTHNLLGAIDYESVRQIRNENFEFLKKEFEEINLIQVDIPDGAFAYPFYIENGIKIRRELAKKNLYIPTLWNNILKNTEEKSLEYRYSANILPIPCDQRYGVSDMEYITNLIKEVKR